MSDYELGLKAAWEAIDAKIVRGDLPGNGCDDTAQRNGMILACNIIAEMMGHDPRNMTPEQVKQALTKFQRAVHGLSVVDAPAPQESSE